MGTHELDALLMTERGEVIENTNRKFCVVTGHLVRFAVSHGWHPHRATSTQPIGKVISKRKLLTRPRALPLSVLS